MSGGEEEKFKDIGAGTHELAELSEAKADQRYAEMALDFAEIKTRIKRNLKGKYFDPETDTWKIPKDNEGNEIRLLNDQGVDELFTWIDSHIHKGVVLSNIDDKEIYRLMLYLNADLARVIGENARKWGIGDRETAKIITINNIVMNNIYFILKRAKKGGERSSLTKATKTLEKWGGAVKDRAKKSFGVFG